MTGSASLTAADLSVSQDLGQVRPAVPADVLAEIKRLTGTDVIRARRLDGGASRSGWQVDLATPGGDSRTAYLRLGSVKAGAVASAYNVVREAEIVRDLLAHEIPVPAVIAISTQLPLALMEFVPGQSDFGKVDSVASRRSLAHQYLHSLNAVHRLDPASVWSFGVDRPATIADAIAADVQQWGEFSAPTDTAADPLVAMTLQWLNRNIPANREAPCLVHGDAGPGNFMFRNRRVTAIVDWELAHLGDPIEDFGWILLRAAELPGDELRWWVSEFARYNHLTVDEQSVRFHRVLALFKTIVALSSSLASGPTGRTAQLLSLQALYRTYLCRLLAEGLDVAVSALPEIPSYAGAAATAADVAVAVEAAELLQEALASGDMDSATKVTIRRSRIILGYLARRADAWPAAVEAICHMSSDLLGQVPGDVAALLDRLAPYADLDRADDATRSLLLLTELEQRQLALWPGLPRRATAGLHRTSDLVGGGAA
jgi:aminoglycoside phosphotransferase (APT) family kinase protein